MLQKNPVVSVAEQNGFGAGPPFAEGNWVVAGTTWETLSTNSKATTKRWLNNLESIVKLNIIKNADYHNYLYG